MITVPQGGSVAGRSADIRVERPDMGGFISQVGSAVAQKMGQIKDQQRDVKLAQTELAMTKELGQEYQRVAQYTDPTQIETEWPQIEARIRDKYVSGKDESGQPLLTPEEADRLDLNLGSLSMKHGFELGSRAIQLTQSEAIAAWMTAETDIVNEAATADENTMGAYLEFGKAQIAELGKRTGKGAAEVVAEQQAFEIKAMNARATTAADADPVAFRAALAAGKFDVLGAERVAALGVSNQAEIDRRAAAEIKAVEAQQTETNRIMGQKLDDIAGVAAKGVPVADRDLLKDPAYMAHPKYAATMAAVSLADEKPGIAQMTPAQLRAAIQDEKSRPKSAPYQAERQVYLEALLTEAEKGWATDGAGQAKKSGLPIPELDPEDIEALPEAIASRMAYAETLQRDGYVKDARTAVMDETERATLRAATAPEADLEPKLDLALAIAEGTKGNADWLNRTIGTDPVFAEATRVLIETGSEDLARSMLRGQQKVAMGNVVLPPKNDLVAVFDEVTGGVYEDDPTVAARIREAAMAVYADSARGLNPNGTDSAIPFMDDEAAKEAVALAVRRVTGASPDAAGNLTVGGAQPYRDAIVPLPPGVPLEDLEAAVENIGRQMDGQVLFEEAGRFGPANQVPGADPAAVDPMRAFRAASVDARGQPDGRVPDIDDPGLLDILQIQKVPGRKNEYRFVYPGDGRPQIILDESGLEYRFRIDALIRGAAK